MIRYLSGAINAHVLSNRRPDVGIMIQPRMGNDPSVLALFDHAIDNDCYAQGESFVESVWLDFLTKLSPYQSRTLFATAPDVVGDAAATLRRSTPYLPIIREMGYPVAFVTQDGADLTPLPWDDFDALFVGGTDAWKLGEPSWRLCAEARRRDKWVHVGRCNSLRRLRACAISGVQSVDGTFLRWGPDINWPRLTGWLDVVNEHPPMELFA